MFIASSFSAVGSRRNNIWLVDSCFWISRQLNDWSRRLELDKIQKNKLTMPVLWFKKKREFMSNLIVSAKSTWIQHGLIITRWSDYILVAFKLSFSSTTSFCGWSNGKRQNGHFQR
jgi:hypothetical protein